MTITAHSGGGFTLPANLGVKRGRVWTTQAQDIVNRSEALAGDKITPGCAGLKRPQQLVSPSQNKW